MLREHSETQQDWNPLLPEGSSGERPRSCSSTPYATQQLQLAGVTGCSSLLVET